ncbi:MAG: Ig-like domain-containing protein, partial [bacterium]
MKKAGWLALVGFLVGCGGGGGGAVTLVTILSSLPANGSSGISLGTAVQVTFDRAMKRSSVEVAFSITPAAPGAFQWDAGSTVMTFTPSSLLPVTTAHTVRIKTTGEAADGGRLDVEFVLNFTTGSTVAQIPGAPTDAAVARIPDLPFPPLDTARYLIIPDAFAISFTDFLL